MRMLLIFVLLVFARVANAQTIIQDPFLTDTYGAAFPHHLPSFDSSLNRKWSFSKYAGISAGYSFFKGGSASVFSVPIGLQLNRRLTDHVYAFTGVSVAPAYVSVNGAFLPGSYGSKANSGNLFSRTGSFGVYSKAELGLMYINESKTFSISGSIGVERSSTPVFYQGANRIIPHNVVPSGN